MSMNNIKELIEQKEHELEQKMISVEATKRELEELRNTEYAIRTGRHRVTVNGTRCIKMKDELLPIEHPEYGGTLTFPTDLKVGTSFFVTNGHWRGKIVEVDGVKKLEVEGGNPHDIDTDYYLWCKFGAD